MPGRGSRSCPRPSLLWREPSRCSVRSPPPPSSRCQSGHAARLALGDVPVAHARRARSRSRRARVGVGKSPSAGRHPPEPRSSLRSPLRVLRHARRPSSSASTAASSRRSRARSRRWAPPRSHWLARPSAGSPRSRRRPSPVPASSWSSPTSSQLPLSRLIRSPFFPLRSGRRQGSLRTSASPPSAGSRHSPTPPSPSGWGVDGRRAQGLLAAGAATRPRPRNRRRSSRRLPFPRPSETS